MKRLDAIARAALGGAALLAALLAAGCGGAASYEDQLAGACEQARVAKDATPAAAAGAGRKALAAVRGLDGVPEARKDAVTTLLQQLTQQQRALDDLARGVAGHAKTARLRELVGAVEVQAALVAPTARKAGAPACGGGATALVTALHTQDYAVQMGRFFAEYDARVRAEPALRTGDNAKLLGETVSSYHVFSDLADDLQTVDAPGTLARDHQRLDDALTDAYAAFDDAEQHLQVGNDAPVRREIRGHRRAVARFATARRALQAKLARVPVDARWGTVDVAAVRRTAAAARKATYIDQVGLELHHLSEALAGQETIHDGDSPRRAARVLRHSDHQVELSYRYLAGAQPPARVARAHGLMVSGMAALAAASERASAALVHADYRTAIRELNAVLHGAVARKLRAADRAFRAAGYAKLNLVSALLF